MNTNFHRLTAELMAQGYEFQGLIDFGRTALLSRGYERVAVTRFKGEFTMLNGWELEFLTGRVLSW